MLFKKIPIFIGIIVILSLIGGVTADIDDETHLHDENIGDVIYVSPSGCDYNDGLTPSQSKQSINKAVKAVKNRGTIIISPGTYKEWDTVQINKAVILTGAGQKNTIIDGKSSQTCVSVKEGCTAVIQELTIQNGKGDAHHDYDGGGIYNKGTLILRDCTVTHNKAPRGYGDGGGIYNKFSLTVENCTITKNNARNYGGGIYDYYHESYTKEDKTVIRNSKINDNKAFLGGGMYIDDFAILEHTQIQDNNAEYKGGGIYFNGGYIDSLSRATSIKDCVIKSNYAEWYGGGVYNENNKVNFFDSRINRNWAKIGGGVYNENGKITYNNTNVSGNWLWNYGGKK